eukprot:364374-Chlamydomonas_euryale.AAC.6
MGCAIGANAQWAQSESDCAQTHCERASAPGQWCSDIAMRTGVRAPPQQGDTQATSSELTASQPRRGAASKEGRWRERSGRTTRAHVLRVLRVLPILHRAGPRRVMRAPPLPASRFTAPCARHTWPSEQLQGRREERGTQFPTVFAQLRPHNTAYARTERETAVLVRCPASDVTERVQHAGCAVDFGDQNRYCSSGRSSPVQPAAAVFGLCRNASVRDTRRVARARVPLLLHLHCPWHRPRQALQIRCAAADATSTARAAAAAAAAAAPLLSAPSAFPFLQRHVCRAASLGLRQIDAESSAWRAAGYTGVARRAGCAPRAQHEPPQKPTYARTRTHTHASRAEASRIREWPPHGAASRRATAPHARRRAPNRLS